MKRLVHALLAAVLLTAAGTSFFYSPIGQRIEETLGLALLFKLRGPREPPDKTVIVNIDEVSPQLSERHDHYSKWPRSIYASLIDRLILFKAQLIVFDIHFAEKKDDDAILSEAIERAGNVILVEDMQHRSLASPLSSPEAGRIEMDVLVPPIRSLAEACLCLAPFPLPKLPVRINRAWLFKSSSGDIPTLPAVVFQAATLDQYSRLCSLAHKKSPADAVYLPPRAEEALADLGLVETMRHIRSIYQKHSRPGWREFLSENDADFQAAGSFEQRRNLKTLIDMYSGDQLVYVDFYGPPASHRTISFADLLAEPKESEEDVAAQIRDKVVFIGAAKKHWSKQKDGFYTVFSQKNGLDISGVELAATIFANLYEDRRILQPSLAATLGFLLLCGTVACLISFLLQPIPALVLLLVFNGLALMTAHFAFSLNGIWIPVVTPLALLPLCAFLLGTISNYWAAHRERRHIRTALGYYVPNNVVKELSRDLSFIDKGDKKVYSTCLMTDAQHYTTLSESMQPEELSRHMKEYYRFLFREVKDRDGIIGNVIGDSMLALWPSSKPEASLRLKACQAALQINAAIEEFNRKHPLHALPTRVGLHTGYVLMDNIGALDHFEYAPVGDIVNTASRIEGLNKHLGTRILASGETVEGMEGIQLREVGLFLLGGKTRPVTIFEMLPAEKLSSEHYACKTIFAEALNDFHQRRWRQALDGFDHCLVLNSGDGPAQLYRRLCKAYLVSPPPADWQGVIKIEK